MCQTSVFVEKDGVEERRFDDVISLLVEGTDIRVTTLFEGATEIKNVFVSSIDFMAGKVLLQKKE